MTNEKKALGILTEASFQEDPYGQVQRDLPAILNMLKNCANSLKERSKRVNGESLLLNRANPAFYGPVIHSELYCLLDCVERTTCGIAMTFYERLRHVALDESLRRWVYNCANGGSLMSAGSV